MRAFIFTTFSFFTILLFSCGPRSGVKETKTEEGWCGVRDEPKNTCGNAIGPADYKITAELLKMTGDGERGRFLFKQNCSRCHTIGLGKLTGPDLVHVYNRVPSPQGEWFKKYITNRKKMLDEGDPYSAKLHGEYPDVPMDVFEGVLSEQEINNIIIYMVTASK